MAFSLLHVQKRYVFGTSKLKAALNAKPLFFHDRQCVVARCFFFSQQSNTKKWTTSVTATSFSADEPIMGNPDCETVMTDEEKIKCYNEAEVISRRLIDAKLTDIFALESDPEQRIDFMETQFNWEVSRDADCNFLHQVSEESGKASLRDADCIHKRNLARLALLKELLGDLYDPASSAGAEIVDE